MGKLLVCVYYQDICDDEVKAYQIMHVALTLGRYVRTVRTVRTVSASSLAGVLRTSYVRPTEKAVTLGHDVMHMHLQQYHTYFFCACVPGTLVRTCHIPMMTISTCLFSVK